MKSRYLQLLVALSCVAVLGLIALQVYWVNNTFLLREQDFGSNVTKALNKVSEKLEKEEIRFLQNSSSGSPSVRVSGSGNSNIIISSSKKDVNLVKDATLDESRDSAFYSKLGSGGIDQSQILKQSGLLDDIMGGTLELDIISKSINERIDTTKVDSLIRSELEYFGIKAPFELAVFNKMRHPQIIAENVKPYAELFYLEGYTAKLFPNDPYSDINYLRVWFPNQKGYLLRSMSSMLATSIALLLVIMLLFSFSIRTIYRQKN